MALPRMQTPIYNTVIPSTQESIKFRPFLVREEKALLIAQQSEDNTILVDTLKNIVKSCVINKINIDSLAMFDLEYLLLQIRARSVGENVELSFRCDTCTEEQAIATLTFDLTKMGVTKDPLHAKKLELFDDVGVVMKYPTIDAIKKFEDIDMDSIDNVFDLIIESIDYIYSGDNIYHSKEQTKTELIDFVENLTQEQFQKIKVFFDTMPKLRQDIVYTCPVCQKLHKKYIEGIESFF
jgi:hypothetical protein